MVLRSIWVKDKKKIRRAESFCLHKLFLPLLTIFVLFAWFFVHSKVTTHMKILYTSSIEIWPLNQFIGSGSIFSLGGMDPWWHTYDRVCRASQWACWCCGCVICYIFNVYEGQCLDLHLHVIYPDMQSESEHSMIYCIWFQIYCNRNLTDMTCQSKIYVH